jgi:DnaJ-class molecular chaperone
MEYKDYYKTLNVTKKASPEEIMGDRPPFLWKHIDEVKEESAALFAEFREKK